MTELSIVVSEQLPKNGEAGAQQQGLLQQRVLLLVSTRLAR
jgi:hypothetical protein